jgi:hypothetical protein
LIFARNGEYTFTVFLEVLPAGIRVRKIGRLMESHPSLTVIVDFSLPVPQD